MAVNPNDLTIDYKTLQAIPFRDRKALLYSSFSNQIDNSLTPSQRANLFPSHYQKDAAAIQSAMTGATNLSKAEYLNRARNNAGVGYGDANRVAGTPKQKGPPAITASEFRAVESNPFLAGYADKTVRSPGRQKISATDFMDPRTSGKLRPEILEKYKDRNFPVTIRNNNMGAVSLADDSNKFVTGMAGYVGKTPRPAAEGGYYAKFSSPEHGVAAASKNLENYYKKGINTPEGIVRKWAKGANQNYISTVVSYLNNSGYKVDQTSQLDLSDPNVRIAILKAKSSFESGAGVPVYNDDVYETGVNYAFEENKIETANPTSTPDALAVVTKVAAEVPTAAELKTTAENLDINATTESALGFLNNKERNPDGANLVEADPRLLEISEMGIRKFEAENPNLKVEIYGPNSGKRTTSKTTKSQHLTGDALDFEIFEVDPKTGKKTGRRLANFSNQTGAGEAGDEYLKLHQNIELARIYKKDVVKDPRYEGVYGRSGALFGGEYAFDTMHYDIGGTAAPGGIESAAQPGGTIFGGYSEEYQRMFGTEQAAMSVKPEQAIELAQTAFGPKKEELPTVVNVPEVNPTVLSKVESTPPTNTTSAESNISSTATEVPKSSTVPLGTMAQGGTIRPIGDSEIVTRSPTSGEIIQRTKVAEYGSEQIKIEPVSKMNADALSPDRNNMNIQSNEQSAPVQQEQPAQVASMKSGGVPVAAYSNIDSYVRKPNSTALRAAMQIRMVNTDRADYIT